ncbi:MAG: HAD family phosphatase [Alphaproteobacteria bacterium]|nr:HAD family phosphatase [Alphaproteobacteria bacterium]
MKKKLVIFDFDGVIADSEKIWLKNRQEQLNLRYNLGWDFETTNKHIGGMSDKTKREVLINMGIITDDEFWKVCMEKDLTCIKNNEMEKIPHIEEVLECIDKYCVATGGVYAKTLQKIKSIGMWGTFFDDNNLFTVDLVERGKPEPDLFLYACQKMGEEPKDCIVIEDSIVGMTAGIRAGMDVIAFLGSEMYQNEKYLERVKELGIKDIFYNMKDVKEFLLKK